MFSLVIALIAIALVAVLAGASVYYGTDAFQGNKSKARYAEIVNQSEQISSAFLAFRIEGNELDPDTCNNADPSGCLQQLVDASYLSAVPERGETEYDWDVDADGGLYTTTNDRDACILANESKGYQISAYPAHDDLNQDGVPDTDVVDEAVAVGAICVEQ